MPQERAVKAPPSTAPAVSAVVIAIMISHAIAFTAGLMFGWLF
jgi:hypothetical protein